MRGSVISLYAFRIKTVGYDIEDLDVELSKKRINKEEHKYLVDFYNRNIAHA